MERLHTALQSALYAEGGPDEAKMSSRLFDACLEAGMSFDEPSHTDWAVARCTADLLSAA